MPILPISLLFAGCFPRLDIVVPAVETDDTGGTTVPTDDTGDTVVPTIAIDSVLPVQGPSGGGTEVVIEGGPFDASTQVWFGDIPGTLQSWATDQVIVRSPATTDLGLTDLYIERSDGLEGEKPDAWTYWQDAEGRNVVLGAWLQMIVANETTWGTTSAPTFDAWVRLVEGGLDVQPWQIYGVDRGTCAARGAVDDSDQGPEDVAFGYAEEELSLRWSDTRGEYAWQGASQPEFRSSAHLNLQVNATSLTPALALDELGQLPPFPPTMLTPDFGADEIPELAYSGATVRWTTGGHPVLLMMVGDGRDIDFVCAFSDTGTATIPTEALDLLSWTVDAEKAFSDVWMGLIAIRQDDQPLTWADGDARVDAGVGTIGRVRIVASPDEVDR